MSNTPTDLARLRALLLQQPFGLEERIAVQEQLYDMVPAALDELEALRAEVKRLRDSYWDSRAAERAAVVAWLRSDAELWKKSINEAGPRRAGIQQDLANAPERGDHHESAQPPPATRPRYCYRCNDSGTITWDDGSEMPCDHCQKGKQQ